MAAADSKWVTRKDMLIFGDSKKYYRDKYDAYTVKKKKKSSINACLSKNSRIILTTSA